MAEPNDNDTTNDSITKDTLLHQARRLKAWAKVSLPRGDCVDFDENSSETTCRNIDQAMESLKAFTMESTASYIPNADYNWFLDGDPDWQDEFQYSQQLLQGLTLEWSQIEQLALQHCTLGRQDFQFAQFTTNTDTNTQQQQQKQQQQDGRQQWQALVDMHDDDDFGDFQSANNPSEKQNENAPTQTTSPQNETVQQNDKSMESTTERSVLGGDNAAKSSNPPQTPTIPFDRSQENNPNVSKPLDEQPDTLQHTPEQVRAKNVFKEAVSLLRQSPSVETASKATFDLDALRNTSFTEYPPSCIQIAPGESSHDASLDEDDEGYTRRPMTSLTPPKNTTTPPRSALSKLTITVDPGNDATTNASRFLHSTPTQLFRTEDTVLSLTDIQTPEGRFARRQSLRSSSSIEDNDGFWLKLQTLLPNDYLHTLLDPTADDTLDLLTAMPWEHVPFWQTPSLLSDDIDESLLIVAEEHLTTELSEMDDAHAQVKAELLQRVQPHVKRLKELNQEVHLLQQNLSLGQIYADRAKESLKEAKGDDDGGIVGAVALLDAWDQKKQYEQLQHVLSKVTRALELEQTLKGRMEAFDPSWSGATEECQQLLQCAIHLQETVEQDVSQITCMAALRERASKILDTFWNRLLIVLQSIAIRCCTGSFSSLEYERLVQAAKAIDQQTTSQTEIASSWSLIILKALCCEADRALAFALLNPTNANDSEYEKDLIQLSLEIKQDWGDSAKLLNLTHNLVTIRFDFEANETHLFDVYHRLCVLLFDILHAHCVLTQWHSSGDDSGHSNLSERFLSELTATKVYLWNHCEGVLNTCLEKYLNFAAKKKLFGGEKGGQSDDSWLQDLKGLHGVLQLTHQFLSLRDDFLSPEEREELGSTRSDCVEEGSDLFQNLKAIFKKHLRLMHVEAMNGLGARLSTEDWKLVTLEPRFDPLLASEPRPSVHQLLIRALRTASPNNWWEISHLVRSNGFAVKKEGGYFANVKDSGNPFLVQSGTEGGCLPRNGLFDHGDYASDPTCEAYKILNYFLGAESGCSPRMVPQSFVSKFSWWIPRLLVVIKMLPPIVEDTLEVLFNMSDLYLTTVFRLCAGSAKNERVVLGLETPTTTVLYGTDAPPSPAASKPTLSSSSPLFGFGRKGRPLPTKRLIPSASTNLATLDAEICAPLPSQAEGLSTLTEFINRGQECLKGVVNLNQVDHWMVDPPLLLDGSTDEVELIAKSTKILEKRTIAAWSCLFIAVAMDIGYCVAKEGFASPTVEHREEDRDERVDDDERLSDPLSSFKSYSEVLLETAPRLLDISLRISCTRAMGGREVVKKIAEVGTKWEEAKLNEHPNDYIEECNSVCAMIWGALSSSSNKLPAKATERTWQHLVEAGFLSLLEGFSKVPFCSTEGRALMSMDLAAFSAGIAPASVLQKLEHAQVGYSVPPPLVSPDRGMSYVDLYIKVFYFPQEDAIKWIEEHYQDYQLNHCLSLIAGIFCDYDGNSENSVRETIRSVKQLYQQPNSA